jgi:ABC-type molybdenum transport system ATPase subunit/photorepair protein PhrA
MTFTFTVPTPSGSKQFLVEPGTSIYFVGANGGGKTRLAVKIESELGDRCHRISAHRALTLNPGVPKVSEKMALRGLRFGYASDEAHVGYREHNRWGQKAAVQLLNDYDFLVQALFAEQSNTSLQTHNNMRAGNLQAPQLTKFETLSEIWGRILPHRKLQITGDDIRVAGTLAADTYSGSDMSDGERAVLYLIGQALSALPNTLIIFDEPELHIHRAVMSRLWDELEASRPDCALLVISHDLEFVASRAGQKFALLKYDHGGLWTIEDVPENAGFSAEITTLILGSRKPILFVEGRENSLDNAIYRACYPDWTVIPRSSCEEVIHAVITMRANATFTRVRCAGIVDADDYSNEDAILLREKGIEILPVSEIENLIMLPPVLEAIAASEGYRGQEMRDRVASVVNEALTQAAESGNQKNSVLRYCRRRIDRALKKVDLSAAESVAALNDNYRAQTAALNIPALANEAQQAMQQAIEAKDIAVLLRWYDNKGLLALAAKMKGTTKKQFEQWIIRSMRNESVPELATAIRQYLPELAAI